MVLVKATEQSKVLKLKLKELHRIAELGEEFETTEERYKFLAGDNPLNKKFVVLVEKVTEAPVVKEEVELTTTTEETVEKSEESTVEEPVKKTRKRKKKDTN